MIEKSKETHSSGVITAAVAMAANIIIGIVKFIAAAISGSSAMMSEGIHSVVDSGNELLILIGIKQSKKKPDLLHPFGYGVNLYFYIFVVSILIFALGGGVAIYDGYNAWINAGVTELGDPTLSYAILLIAMVIEGASWFVAFKQINKLKGEKTIPRFIHESKDPSVFTVLLEDTAAEIGLFVAFIGIFCSHTFNEPHFDAVASFVIGLILIIVAIILLKETKDLLLGEGMGKKAIQDIISMVESNKEVENCGSVLTMYVGPDNLLVAIDVAFKQDLSERELINAIDNIESQIIGKYPQTGRVFIEAESLSVVIKQKTIMREAIEK